MTMSRNTLDIKGFGSVQKSPPSKAASREGGRGVRRQYVESSEQ